MDWIGEVTKFLKVHHPLRCGCERRPWSGDSGGRREARRVLGVVDGPVGPADGGVKMGCGRNGARVGEHTGWEGGRTEDRQNHVPCFFLYFILFRSRDRDRDRGQHIMWKPTSTCKLWKLQSESHDVDPTGRSEEVGGVICKITFANHVSHLPLER
jgi:hypothetical protein